MLLKKYDNKTVASHMWSEITRGEMFELLKHNGAKGEIWKT